MLKRYGSTLTPLLGTRPVDTLKRADFVKVVRLVEGKGIIETAHRVAGRLCAVMDYAVDEGYLEQHPAAGLTRIIAARPRVQAHGFFITFRSPGGYYAKSTATAKK